MFISRPVSKDLRRILQLATETAVQYRYEEPRTPFVLNALHKDGISDASKIFRDYVTVAGLRYALLQRWGMTAEGPTVNYRRLLDPANFDPILLAAEAYADQAGSKVLGPVHLARCVTTVLSPIRLPLNISATFFLKTLSLTVTTSVMTLR